MNYKMLFTIKTLITVLLASSLIISPVWINQVFGIGVSEGGEILAFYLLASFIAIALVCRLNRGSSLSQQKNAFMTLAACDTLSIILTAIVLFQVIPKSWGWVLVLLWFSTAAGSLFYNWFNRIVFDSVQAA